ncbi:ABC transporter substrate-binding protein [Streptomyces sp. PSKA54]|uniref:Probable sugar-binding periplasmic protein n=1 Tax=Streptomyces himalayensis subsp. aureolus TaxID=2758039 RepID=A0A7W2CZ80_9ACTN|nr:ABC transporter substrate-binding protein [Streptomyces himalayensis]MBA4861759.1 ABC transporter substrate-binding protein [Streptomyces himalayensis subsp. aureolus]
MPRITRVCLAGAFTALALTATACTGSSTSGATDDAGKPSTITFWHPWSAPTEVKAIEANVAAFEKAHPNIKVKVVGNVDADKVNQALRAGGSNAPDVVASPETSNVGKFCSSGVFADLDPFLKKSKIDTAKTFPKPMLDYTQFEGTRCALPLLGDAYGLYYNKTAFEKAGITSPPKTLSEFKADAIKLTKTKGDSYSQLGWMPNFHGYEVTVPHLAAQWSPTYFDASGKSNVAKDPAFKELLTWQSDMVKALGGYKKLEKYRSTFGDEWSAQNPLHTGQIAMNIDGEWRGGMMEDAGVDFEWGVAPFPVPDDQADTYGKGFLTGTVIGLASTSSKQNAAWELVKYMTTDTDAVVSFANAINNIPSTFEALKSPKLEDDQTMQAFVKIAENPDSNTTPAAINGSAYQDTLQNFAYDYESGKEQDLDAGLEKTAEQIDTDIAQAK